MVVSEEKGDNMSQSLTRNCLFNQSGSIFEGHKRLACWLQAKMKEQARNLHFYLMLWPLVFSEGFWLTYRLTSDIMWNYDFLKTMVPTGIQNLTHIQWSFLACFEKSWFQKFLVLLVATSYCISDSHWGKALLDQQVTFLPAVVTVRPINLHIFFLILTLSSH